MPSATLDEFDAHALLKADLLKSLQLQNGSEDGKGFLSSMSKAAEAYPADLASFWRNVCVNLVNSVSSGRNIPDFSEGAQVVKSVLESGLLLTACINNASVTGREVLSSVVDLLREEVVCGRCGFKGHYHTTCYKVANGGGGKAGKGKGSNHGPDFSSHLPPPYHPHPAQFGHFGPRPPPFN